MNKIKNTSNFLAIDFGAESGRAIIVSLAAGRVSLEEIHRFPNKPSLMNGTLYWDLPFLFREIITSLKKAAGKNIILESIAVDTWGVDFALLDKNGDVLANPVHHRDERTSTIKEFSPLSDSILFEKTGCFPWNIASLFQLYSLVKNNSPHIEISSTFLNMPDLFNYLLCGKRVSEITIASTSLIMGKEGVWDKQIQSDFNLPSIFPDIVRPGTVLAPLREEILSLTGHKFKDMKVVTTCSHDTASVAAIVPERTENSAFLSSGTWSILGKIFTDPRTAPEVMAEGFTNEASLDSWYLCKNIIGLFPFQELKRFWELSDDPWDYQRMCDEASEAEAIGLVDLEHVDFKSPGDIVKKLEKHLTGNSFPSIGSRGEAARVILESLALEYALNVKKLEKLSDTAIDTLYILGGGMKNSFLCQRTADLCRVKVIAGIDQGTALGNGLVQAYALGYIESPEEIRKIASGSFKMKTYQPEADEDIENKLNKYKRIKTGVNR